MGGCDPAGKNLAARGGNSKGRFRGRRWVEASSAAKGFDSDSDLAGEEWLAGPYGVLVAAGALRKSLQRLDRGLNTFKRSWVSAGPDGRAVVRVLPVEWWEPLAPQWLPARCMDAAGGDPGESLRPHGGAVPQPSADRSGVRGPRRRQHRVDPAA